MSATAAAAPASRPRTLGEALRWTAAAGAHGYLHLGGRPVEQPYSQLLGAAERLGAGLRARGVAAGEPLLLAIDHTPTLLTALWGCLLTGAVPVVVPAPETAGPDPAGPLTSSPSQRRHVWEVAGRPRVLCSSGAIDRLAEDLDTGRTDRWLAFEELAERPRSAVADLPPPAPDDLALLLATSGSTAAPRLVMLSHRNVLSQLAGMAAARGLGRDDVCLNWLPLAHGAGLLWTVRSAVLGCRHLHGDTAAVLADPVRWLDWLAEHRVTRTWVPGFALRLLLADAARVRGGHRDLSALRTLAISSEPVVAQTAAEIQALLAPHGLRADALQPAYGMSETAGNLAVSLAFDAAAAAAAGSAVDVGAPIGGMRLRIAENERVLPDGQEGEVQVAGPALTAGYYRDPEATRAARTADGWWRTGDLGRLDGGRLTLTGRRKEIAIVHGVNVSLAAVERAAQRRLGLPAAEIVACALRPPGSDTESVGLFFHVPGGADPRCAERLRSAVERECGIAPAVVVPLAPGEFPRTAVGKVRREELARRWARGELRHREAAAPPGPAAARPPTREQAVVLEAVAEVLRGRTGGEIGAARGLDLDRTFSELGLSSVERVQLSGRLRRALPDLDLAPQDLLAAATPRQLADRLEGIGRSRVDLAAARERGRRRRARRLDGGPAAGSAS